MLLGHWQGGWNTSTGGQKLSGASKSMEAVKWVWGRAEEGRMGESVVGMGQCSNKMGNDSAGQ